MERQLFTQTEVEEKIGNVIQVPVDFSGVPKGTTGTVIKADASRDEGYTLAFQWHLPSRGSTLAYGETPGEEFTYTP